MRPLEQIKIITQEVDCFWNMMVHKQKPDFVFRRNGRFHLNQRVASVQSTTGSRGVRISGSNGSNAAYIMFRGSVKSSPFKSARGRQFSRLLAAEVCASAVVTAVMLHTSCSEVVWRVAHLNQRVASVQSTTGSRGVRISDSNGSNAGYTMFRGSVKSTGYPLHSPAPPSLPLPCFTVCHHISIGFYVFPPQMVICGKTCPAVRGIHDIYWLLAVFEMSDKGIPSDFWLNLRFPWQWMGLFWMWCHA